METVERQPKVDVGNRSTLGENLIFIISQPRSGSTLLQRILASHPLIHSSDEPWIMLNAFASPWREGIRHSSKSQLVQTHIDSFLDSLPGGKEEYFEGIRRMYSYLYDRALVNSGKSFFLDKTPPYYSLISELFRTFPNAKYIFLLRNPLAVLNAIIDSWIQQSWLSINLYKDHLVSAPPLLIRGIEDVAERGLVVHYESLVTAPEAEIQRICNWLDISFDTKIVDYGKQGLARWGLSDPNLYNHSRPHTDSIDKWKKSLADPQVWRIMNDYLNEIGRATTEALGYSFDELTRYVTATRPTAFELWSTFSLQWLLEKPFERRRIWDWLRVRTITSFRKRGAAATARLGIRRGLSAISLPPLAAARSIPSGRHVPERVDDFNS